MIAFIVMLFDMNDENDPDGVFATLEEAAAYIREQPDQERYSIEEWHGVTFAHLFDHEGKLLIPTEGG